MAFSNPFPQLHAEDRAIRTWIETAESGDNAAVAATRTAEVNRRHYVTSVSGSYSPTASDGEMRLEAPDGTELGQWFFAGAFHVMFPLPVEIEVNTAVLLELDAGGAAGDIGRVVMTGFTVNDT